MTHRIRLSIVATLLAACLALSTSALAEPSVTLPDLEFAPEGIAIDRAGLLYTGSLTQGRIVRADPTTGDVVDFVAPGVGGLVSVVGLLVSKDDRLLYACSSDPGLSALTGTARPALVAFDLGTGDLVGRYELPGEGGFCNDLTELRDGTILATDSFEPRIYALRPGTEALEIWFEDESFRGEGFNLNGIAATKNVVYVVRYNEGTLHGIELLRDGEAGELFEVSLPRPLQAPDGLKALPGRRLLVVEGGGLSAGDTGAVSILKLKRNRTAVRVVAAGLDIPTTAVVRHGFAYVVEGQLDHLFDPEAGTASPYRILKLPLGPEGAWSSKLW